LTGHHGINDRIGPKSEDVCEPTGQHGTVKVLSMRTPLSTSARSAAAPEPEARPLVSVILPTYNRCQWLPQAIESVLGQTYAPLELIVVDDGSTDGTRDLLKSYGSGIQVLHQANTGVSGARNAGIRAARGELIALLDSDDRWLPEKLEHQVAYFQASRRAMICQTEEIWIRNGKRVNPKKRHRKYSGMIFEKTLPLCLVSPSAVMMRAALFREVGLFDEALPACEDYDLWLRICWKYPVHLIPIPLIVKHGGHADQLSAMPELDKYRIQALVKILAGNCLSPSQRASAMATLATKCSVYAGGCRKRGRLDEAAYYERLTEMIAQGTDIPTP
jgi:GT2 family glycosyltransferase